MAHPLDQNDIEEELKKMRVYQENGNYKYAGGNPVFFSLEKLAFCGNKFTHPDALRTVSSSVNDLLLLKIT